MVRPNLTDEWLTAGVDPLLAGYTLSWWLKTFGLPLHIAYAPLIRRNLRAFRRVFAQHYPKGQICFAVKAATYPALLNIVHEEGCGADVASCNETRCALEAGIPAHQLDLNGNCKEDFLLSEAIQRGMTLIADCIEEVDLIEQMAARLQQTARVLLRVSGYRLDQVTNDSIFTAGLWTKFGSPLAAIPEFIRSLERFRYVQLAGFHTHIGSQITRVEPYLAVIARLIELGHLLNQTGRRCEVINIGGGFPIRYVEKADWDSLVRRIRDGYVASRQGDPSQVWVWHDDAAGLKAEQDASVHLERWAGESFHTEFPKEKMLEALLTSEVIVNGQKSSTVEALRALGEPTLTIEPGRSIVEDSGITLARVGIVKQVADRHHLVSLELGITSHGEALLGNPVQPWQIVNDPERCDSEPFAAFIAGNLCFSGDMLSRYKVLFQRRPQRGDVLMIRHTGAYTSSFFAANSNAYPRPARVLVDEQGHAQVLRRRDAYAEIVQP